VKFRASLQIAKGLNYLHCCKPFIIHRDLKPDNCLVLDPECSVVKIADLGVAKVKETIESLKTSGQAGTPLYWAPEMHREERYGTSADVFSYALVVWELYAMQHPFRGWTRQQLLVHVGNGDARPTPMPPSSMPTAVAALVQRCWQKDSSARPAMTEVLATLNSASSP